MKVIGSFLVGFFVFLGSPINAQESTSSSVDEQIHERIGEQINELENLLKPRDELINELENAENALRALTESHNAEESSIYKIEMFFDFRDAPYFTGRRFGDRWLGAERNWEIWVLRGALELDLKKISYSRRVQEVTIERHIINQFSLERHAILGRGAKNGGSVEFHRISEMPPFITILLVEKDTLNSDDIYFIGSFDIRDGKIDLGEHSYFKVSSLPVDR